MKSKTKYNRIPLIILSAISAIGLSSMGCTPVNHLSMSSNLTSLKENEFIYENDTLAVEYRFDGYFRTAHVTIHNKQGKPLFVDWSKSSIIVNGEMFLYWTDDVEISASIYEPHKHGSESAFSSNSYVNGSLQRSNPIGFISPFSFIRAKPKSIWNTYDYYKDLKTPNWGLPTYNMIDGENRFNMESDKASLVFRSYLTLSTTSDFSSPFYVDKLFWANGLKSNNAINTSNRSRVSRVTAQSLVIMGVTYTIVSVLFISIMSYALMF